MDMKGNLTPNNIMRYSITDLHTHILPAFDDGAPSVDTAVQMLNALKTGGVDRVALTPHFYPQYEALDSFLLRRQNSFDALLNAIQVEKMPQLCLGAEVRYTPELAQMDLHQLTFGKGNYLLLELPDNGVAPLLDQVLNSIFDQGIIPVFAHIERCGTFRNQPGQLYNYVQMGALAQVSLKALTGKVDSFALICVKKGLAHIISSDAHKISDCVDFLSIKNVADVIPWTEAFAEAIWNNTPLPAFSVMPVKKGLFGYR